MEETGDFEIHPAPSLGGGLGLEAGPQAQPFAAARREGLDRPHVGDRVDEVAGHGRRLPRIGPMNRPAALPEHDQAKGHGGDEDEEGRRERQVDGGEDDHGPADIHERRNDPPDQRVDQRSEIAGRGRDALTEGTGEVLGEVTHRLRAEFVEELEAQADPDPDRRAAGEPTGQPGEQALGGDQAEKQYQHPGDGRRGVGWQRHRIDEPLEHVLLADAAGRRRDHEGEEQAEMPTPARDVMQDEPAGTGQVWGDEGSVRHEVPDMSANRPCWRASSAAKSGSQDRRPSGSGVENRPTAQGRSLSHPG